MESDVGPPDARDALKPCPCSARLPGAVRFGKEVVDDPVAGPSLYYTLWNAFGLFADNDCLGTRNPATRGFDFLTYVDVWQQASAIGAALHTRGVKTGSFVGIASLNRTEWLLCDLACVMYGYTSVPIAVNVDAATMEFMVKQAEVCCIVCDPPCWSTVQTIAPACDSLQYVVIMEPLPGQTAATVSVAALPDDLRVFQWSQLQEVGASISCDHPGSHRHQSELWSICYTSGSTGRPKGAMMTLARWNKFVAVPYLNAYIALCYGGAMAFYSGNMETLYDDFAVAEPTYIAAPPRIYNKLHAEYMLAKAEAVCDGVPEAEAEADVMKQFGSMLGSRLQWLVTGSAPTPEHVKVWLTKCYGVQVFDGFGCTEAGGIATNGELVDGVDCKLIDCPELGYFTTDLPLPRGEICVRTDHMISGYFKDEENTKAAFDEDGYFHTGDIGEKSGKTIRIIDRKKNIFKLSQGEFVVPSRLEGAYESQSELAEQVCILGNPMCSFVVAIVCLVPDADPRVGGASAEDVVRRDFASIAERSGFASWEVPSHILISPEPFSPDNGMLTPSLKVQRAAIARHFDAQLQSIWATETTATASFDAILSEILQSKDSSASSFTQLGGDSLSAVRLVRLVRDRLQVDLPLSDIFSASSIDELTTKVEARRQQQQSQRKPSSSIHGAATGVPEFVKDAKDIDVKDFIGPDLLNDTPAHTRLYCLVRAASEAAARERVMVHARRQQLSRLVLELSRDCGGFGGEGEGRVHMVAGDLSADEYCGVAEEQWHWLSAHVNVLFHCAAEVNWMKLYGNLRAVNVLACLHLLRMATHGGQPTSFHHVSTISCAPAHSDDQRAYEGVLSLEAAQVPGTLGGPYAQSKWVAEHLLMKARGLGVDIVCYRPGMVSPHSVTGCGNVGDYVYRYVRACLRDGVALASDAPFPMAPVDWVCDAVCRLAAHASRQPQSAGAAAAPVYHLVGCYQRTPTYAWVATALSTVVAQRDTPSGPHDALRLLPYADFVAQLRARCTVGEGAASHPLYPLLPLFHPAHDAWQRGAPPRYDAARAALRGAHGQRGGRDSDDVMPAMATVATMRAFVAWMWSHNE